MKLLAKMTDYLPLKQKSNVEHKVNGKCVCEVCNCGKHKCPDPLQKGDYHSSYESQYPKHDGYKPEGKYKMIHKNFILPEDKFYGQSSYNGSYNQQNGTPNKPNEKFVPKGQITLGNDKFVGNSSYIDDYLNRGKGQRAQKYPLPKNQVMPQGKFQGDSSYHANYIPGKTQKQKQYRPEGQLKIGGNHFQGSSSYGADYLNKGVPMRADRIPLPRNQVMPEGKFQGDSSYQSNYIPGKGQKTKQFRPEGELKVGGNHFQGSSSYGADYENRGTGQRAERAPLPRNQVMPQGRFDGDSSYHANYIPGKAELQKQFRPEGQLKIGGSFEGNSSYGADYADKGMGQRAERSALPRNQVIPEGKFDGDSNYHENFLTNKYQKTDQYRPEGELKVGGNHFQGSSSYGADYENRGTGQRAERIPLPRNQVMPQGKFDGNSAYNSNYLSSKIQKNAQIRPQNELKVGEGKFDGGSSYTLDYINKGSPIRSDRVPLPKNQVIPEGRFEGDTSYHGDYIPGKAQKQAQFKPQQQLKVGGKFQGFSTYGDNYRNQERIHHERCPADELSAPRYKVSEKEHIKYNQNTHHWE